MTAAHLHLDEVGVDRGGRRVLDGVSLLAQGGITSILGANGAGKTTLLRCITSVLAPDRGVITVDGLDPRRERERIELRRRIGYLPQDVGFTPGATVFDTLEYLGVLKEINDDRQRRRAVFDALDRVDLRVVVGDKINTLSTGMRRRVGLAAAILGSPRLLVLDEPAAGLDPDERLRLREIVAERRVASTVVISTHLTDEATISDAVVVLQDGAIRFVGTPQQLANCAQGMAWIQHGLPAPDVRASWRLADGQYRCLGSPPAEAVMTGATLEDGYLMLTAPR